MGRGKEGGNGMRHRTRGTFRAGVAWLVLVSLGVVAQAAWAGSSRSVAGPKALDPNSELHIAFTLSFTTMDPGRAVANTNVPWWEPVFDRLINIKFDVKKGPE